MSKMEAYELILAVANIEVYFTRLMTNDDNLVEITCFRNCESIESSLSFFSLKIVVLFNNCRFTDRFPNSKIIHFRR